MMDEVKGAVTGMWRGAVSGAAAGFILSGLVALTFAVATGGVVNPITGGVLELTAQALGAFFMGGMIGFVPGGIIGAAYEGFNEYIEEREIQRHMAHAKALVKGNELYDIEHVEEKYTPAITDFPTPLASRAASLQTSPSALTRLEQQKQMQEVSALSL